MLDMLMRNADLHSEPLPISPHYQDSFM